MAAKLASLALLSSTALAWGPVPSSWSAGGNNQGWGWGSGGNHQSFSWPGVPSDVPTATASGGRPPFTVSASSVAASATAVVPTEPPVAKVLNGTYTGVYQPAYQQDFFLGIPFAQPPIGELRFHNPRSLNSSWSGNRAADAYSSACIGYGSDQYGYPISEDCLYLNVIRPAANTTKDVKLPVALWIHGGGFSEGSGIDKRYNMSFIVQNGVDLGKPFIAVTINYRLSFWGFGASKEILGSGETNLGLRDQRLAMHWIKENIEAFGGDASKVTIWGESAGAASVGFHLTAYNGRDDKLFYGAVMESGNPVAYGRLKYVDTYEPLYNNITRAVGCANSSDTLECLRGVPYAALNAVLNTTGLATAWSPYVDGDFIQKQTSIQVAAGDFVKVPIIDGANSDEGTAFSPSPVNSTAQLLTNLQASTGLVPSLVQQIVDSYSDNLCDQVPATLGCDVGPNGAEWRRSASISGDLVFIAARRYTCQRWAAEGVPAYSYRFNVIPAGIPYFIAVTHFQEVSSVMDNIQGLGYPPFATPPFQGQPQSHIDTAKLMSNSWVSFFVDQNPNTFKNSSAPQWPVYNNGSPVNFVFDANVTSHAEADTFRQAGIAVINSLNIARGV